MAVPVDRIVELGNDTREFWICIEEYSVALLLKGIVEIVNEVLEIVVFGLTLPAQIIPALEFDVPTIPHDTLSYINWIFPLGYFVPLYGSALSAYAVYRVLRWRARMAGTWVEPTEPQ